MANEDAPQPTPSVFSAEDIPSQVPPWRDPELLAEAPVDADYGCLVEGELTPCTREELLRACARKDDKHPPVVWTPENRRFVPPFEVPFLAEVETGRLAGSHRQEQNKARVLTVFFVGITALFITSWEWDSGAPLPQVAQLVLFLGLIFGVLPWVSASYDLRRLRRHADTVLAEQAMLVRYWTWVGSRAVGVALLMCGLIVAAFVCQLASGYLPGRDPIASAGLVKSAVRDGEVWRLLTCVMVHGGIIHIYFNMMAFYTLGRLLEGMVHPTVLMLVFLASALAGSLLSMVLLPEGTSVGASGGILGVIGFVVTLGVLRRGLLPPRLNRSLLRSIFYILIAGVMAWDVIDNGAHLGGVLFGALLGLALVGRGQPEWPLRTGRVVRTVGVLCGFLFVATAGLAIFLMFRPLPSPGG